MNIVSFQFALFFLAFLPLNWLLRPRPLGYRLLLLASSYYAYGSYNLSFLLILFLFSLFTWLLGLGVGKSASPGRRKLFVTLHLVLGLSGLAFFKYYDLFYQTMDALFVGRGGGNPFPQWDIILPIGISFFTFQGVSYVLDVYRDPKQLAENGLDVFIFVAFFPTILSGPILRAKNFLPQLMAPSLTRETWVRAYFLILSGLFKKLVLASYLAEHIVGPVFESPDIYSSGAVALGCVAYSAQILCDFSGYTDLAMGVGAFMGFRIPDNFNLPYAATSLREFWRRWHISFSTWLRDYLYISLGGSRVSTFRKHLNLLLTMTLGGLWHGAGFNYIVWGLLHGFGLIAAHLFKDLRRQKDERHGPLAILSQAGAWALTFCFVTLAWIFFRAESYSAAMNVVKRILAFDGSGEIIGLYTIPIVALVLLREIAGWDIMGFYVQRCHRWPAVAHGLLAGALGALILRLGPDGAPQFIYFQF
jgi:D-alanyl-lipoteichoic acid acyltransferase DltB (MBOAT superfamily)